ncbi:MAG TPA: class I SAM-dependent methyltransferase [Anaerolineaceae bacterium]
MAAFPDPTQRIPILLEKALAVRQPFIDVQHRSALRLFNGFTEGFPDLVVDLYARTVVIFNHASSHDQEPAHIAAITSWVRSALPWVKAILVKGRNAPTIEGRRGYLVYGSRTDDQIEENGVRYAIALQMNADASFYLDTRNLRAWLKSNLSGKTVLNTFAYTASLGAAALAGGARCAVQVDLNRRFLDIGKRTWALNGFKVKESDFISGDFFRICGQMRRQKQIFDCVIIDPPFFSTTRAGKVDLNTSTVNLVNKVRPLVADGGWLVVVNNALFVSGASYLADLEGLCQGGYLEIERILPVPQDITGYLPPQSTSFPADPAPFNHSTKIAILKVRRKDKAVE